MGINDMVTTGVEVEETAEWENECGWEWWRVGIE